MTRGAADGSTAMSGRARPRASACLGAVLAQLLWLAAACSGVPGGPEDSSASSEDRPSGASAAQREVLVVIGVRENRNGTMYAWLKPPVTYYTAEPPPVPEGSGYTLELLDGQGRVVRSVDFAASPISSGGELWVVHVVDPPDDYRRVQIWRGSEKILAMEAWIWRL